MKYDDFMGQVQNRLELSDTGRAVRATRAVLQSLAERLQRGEAEDLAGPLPMEVDFYLESADHGQRFDYDEFLDRVADRASVDRSDAAYYAKVVVGLVSELVPTGEIEQVRAQLPDDFDDAFEMVDAEEVEE